MNEGAAVIPSKWKRVGIQLSLSPGTLDSIQDGHAGKVHSCLDSYEEVFRTWRDQATTGVTCSPYTWLTVIDALKTFVGIYCFCAKYRIITFSFLIRPCYLAFYTTNCLQILYPTNFLVRECFYLLVSLIFFVCIYTDALISIYRNYVTQDISILQQHRPYSRFCTKV